MILFLKKNEGIDQGSSNNVLLYYWFLLFVICFPPKKQKNKLAIPTTRTGHQVHVCTCHINVLLVTIAMSKC